MAKFVGWWNYSLMAISPRKQRALPISPMVVNLTQREEELCALVNDFCNEINADQLGDEPVVCRIAGGWVRDKLLGVDSHDIDIAINTMTGEEFAKSLLDAGKIQSVGVTIMSNPEQSKHLATTRLKILGIEVDLVNLRSESYNKNSRIPSIQFGTPKEDAERRDLTINALYYNINTREVEDFTGKGLEDLKNGIVRTPLEPKMTFEDDPLRVLRCVRFASRLGFQTASAIAEAAREASIQSMLATKISRERIGDEIDKMIRGPDPLYAMQLLHFFDMLPSIFLPSSQAKESANGEIQPMEQAVAGVASLDILLSLSPGPETLPVLDPLFTHTVAQDKSLRARVMLAAAFTPFRGLTYEVKKKRVKLVESVLRDGLKLGSQHHYLDGIPHLFNAAEVLSKAFPNPLQDGNRVDIGMLLRHPSIHNPVTGSEWSSSLLFSLIQELALCWEEGTLNERDATKCIDKYNGAATKIKQFDLPGSIAAPPILDGQKICETLGIKGGPHVAAVMSQVVAWQLEHPEGSVEDCKSWLQKENDRKTWGELPTVDADRVNKRKRRKVVTDSTAE